MVITAHCALGSLKNVLSKMDIVAHAYNPSMREEKGRPGLYEI